MGFMGRPIIRAYCADGINHFKCMASNCHCTCGHRSRLQTSGVPGQAGLKASDGTPVASTAEGRRLDKARAENPRNKKGEHKRGSRGGRKQKV